MNSILDRMGYSLPFHVATDPTIKLSNATAMKASEVLQHFGWAPTSFEHKSSWYGTAKTLSQLNWKGGIPSKWFIVCLSAHEFIDNVYVCCSTGCSRI